MNKILTDFIEKYQYKFTIEIVLINKKITDNIYNININDEQYLEIYDKLRKHNLIEKNVQKYYYNNNYMEISNTNVEYKTTEIIDKISYNNLLVIAKKITNINEDCIPGLNKYHNEINEKQFIFNVNNCNVILKSLPNNFKNIIIDINQNSINSVNNIISSYII